MLCFMRDMEEDLLLWMAFQLISHERKASLHSLGTSPIHYGTNYYASKTRKRAICARLKGVLQIMTPVPGTIEKNPEFLTT